MGDYELLHVRGRHYAKVVDGEIIGMASIGEVKTHRYRRVGPLVEPATIEITLAMAALFALLSSLSLPLLLRLVAAFACLVSVWATEMFCWIFVLARVPLAWTRFYESEHRRREKSLGFQLWLLSYYPKLFVEFFIERPLRRRRLGMPIEESIELAYLTLFFSITAMGVLLIFVVITAFSAFGD